MMRRRGSRVITYWHNLGSSIKGSTDAEGMSTRNKCASQSLGLLGLPLFKLRCVSGTMGCIHYSISYVQI